MPHSRPRNMHQLHGRVRDDRDKVFAHSDGTRKGIILFQGSNLSIYGIVDVISTLRNGFSGDASVANFFTSAATDASSSV